METEISKEKSKQIAESLLYINNNRLARDILDVFYCGREFTCQNIRKEIKAKYYDLQKIIPPYKLDMNITNLLLELTDEGLLQQKAPYFEISNLGVTIVRLADTINKVLINPIEQILIEEGIDKISAKEDVKEKYNSLLNEAVNKIGFEEILNGENS